MYDPYAVHVKKNFPQTGPSTDPFRSTPVQFLCTYNPRAIPKSRFCGHSNGHLPIHAIQKSCRNSTVDCQPRAKVISKTRGIG